MICHRLEDSGYGVGLRLLEVLSYRERNSRREVRLIEMLKFVHTSLWKCLFGRQARELEQSNTVRTCLLRHLLYIGASVSITSPKTVYAVLTDPGCGHPTCSQNGMHAG